MQEALSDFDRRWSDPAERLRTLPGKDALSAVNAALNDVLGVSVTPVAAVEAMHRAEVPEEIATLVDRIDKFARAPTRAGAG